MYSIRPRGGLPPARLPGQRASPNRERPERRLLI